FDGYHLLSAIAAPTTPSSDDGIEGGLASFQRNQRAISPFRNNCPVELHPCREVRREIDLADITAAFDEHRHNGPPADRQRDTLHIGRELVVLAGVLRLDDEAVDAARTATALGIDDADDDRRHLVG